MIKVNETINSKEVDITLSILLFYKAYLFYSPTYYCVRFQPITLPTKTCIE